MNRLRSVSPGPWRPAKESSAFTLVEILVAMAVLVLMTVFLLTAVDQAARIWTQGNGQVQYRERARASLGYIGRELQQALLSPTGSAGPLEFVVNPTTVGTTYRNRDSVFWQTPVATDSSQGDLAEVGYFVAWTGTTANLCRFFVNPSDTANYKLYAQPTPSTWVSDPLLQTVAPASKEYHYQGLFLENVIGLWVNAYQADGTTAYGGDSRTDQRLPAFVQVSLVLLDSQTAGRVGATDVATIQSLYSKPAAADFVAALPLKIRSAAKVSTVRVSLDNYK